MLEYDGCSDFLFEAGTELLKICPPDDYALKEIKMFIEKHGLTRDDVKIIKNKYGMNLVSKIDLTLTILHEGNIDGENMLCREKVFSKKS